ncbi:hypothetical protein LVJ85_08325 [Neisseria sp. Dent CA1/247]|uniref:DUF6414 family protein n=1 Tax=Neisseria sp. Dent CA1/247 TaxID=2912675 RepID=UPI001FD1E367|nr:hypothetical protein [Neisseria sp. Dent CA1/247]UOO76053.1 hypothetical protein LVJ85_08325 [Neisseria sp. Dent CA1/247]
MVHDEAAENSLYDFIYINHEALSLYNAQLDKDGLLTHQVITKSVSDQQKNQLGASVKLVSGGHEMQSSVSESTQSNFDASRAMPLNVIRELNHRGLIQKDVEQAKLGQIVLFSGRLQIVDYALMASIVRPATQMHINEMPCKTPTEKLNKKAKQAEFDAFANLIEQMPKLIQFRLFDDHRSAWGTISSGSLMVHSLDFVMKHAITVPGQWHILAVLDALPDGAAEMEIDKAAFKYMTQMESAYMEAFIHLRGLMGRRLEEYGVSPLAIFRKVE